MVFLPHCRIIIFDAPAVDNKRTPKDPPPLDTANMVKLLILLSLLASASAFTPASHRLPAVGLRQAFASTSLPQALPDWAHEDSEGTQSERAKLDISQTIYTSSFKSPKDAYIAFAEKGAANSKMSKHKILHQVRRRKTRKERAHTFCFSHVFTSTTTHRRF
jgi:hypothetical protein